MYILQASQLLQFNILMNEEYEVIEFDEIQNELDPLDFFSMLQSKIKSGYRVSIMMRKTIDFTLTNKKNALFSKWKEREDVSILFFDKKFIIHDHSFLEPTPGLMISQYSIPQSRNDLDKEGFLGGSSIEHIQDHGESEKRVSQQRLLQAKSPTFINTTGCNTQILTDLKSQLNIESQELIHHEEEQQELEEKLYKESLSEILDDYFKDYLIQVQQNSLYKQLEHGIQQFNNNDLQEAFQQFAAIIDKSRDQLVNQKDTVTSMIFLQAICHQSKVLKILGQFSESNNHLDMITKNFFIHDIGILGKVEIEKGQNFIYLSKLDQALNSFEKALIYYEKVNWIIAMAYTIGRIGYVLALLGQFEEAKRACFEALRLYHLISLTESDMKIQDIYLILAEIEFFKKQYEQSLEQLKQCLTRRIDLLGSQDLSLVKIHNYMGMTYHFLGQTLQAIGSYQKAIELLKNNNNSNQLVLAQILNNLGLAQFDRMYVKSASYTFEKSFLIYKQFYAENHPMMRKIQLNLELVHKTANKSLNI